MKKKLALVLVAALTLVSALALAQSAGMYNPWEELETLEELNEKAGTHLYLPGVMGTETKAFRLLETEEYVLAELIFEVNGTQYILRGSGCADRDLSGVYTEDGRTAFENREAETLSFANTADMKLARWLNQDGQYVFIAQDGGELAEDHFEDLASEMMQMTGSGFPALPVEGMYYDSVSMRAYLSLEALGGANFGVEVHWADSAFEDNVWTMTVSVGEDGLLNYKDCVLRRVCVDESGNVTETEANLIPEGYFEMSDGRLLWSGAAEENCRACVFELAGKAD